MDVWMFGCLDDDFIGVLMILMGLFILMMVLSFNDSLLLGLMVKVAVMMMMMMMMMMMILIMT